MFRVLLFIIMLSTLIFAQRIHFFEEKYYDALESTFEKTGTVQFFEKSMEIKYDGEDNLLIYDGDFLIRKKGDVKEELDLGKKPEVKIFFILFEAVYFDNQDLLASYFEIEKKREAIFLKPRQAVASYVDKVSYRKTDKKLNFLQINLSTKDTIRIEEIDEVR